MNLQLQDCRICRRVIRINRQGHEFCAVPSKVTLCWLEWGMEGQWVDNAIWADTVTRSTLAELWSHRGHVATSAHTAQGAGEQ